MDTVITAIAKINNLFTELYIKLKSITKCQHQLMTLVAHLALLKVVVGQTISIHIVGIIVEG